MKTLRKVKNKVDAEIIKTSTVVFAIQYNHLQDQSHCLALDMNDRGFTVGGRKLVLCCSWNELRKDHLCNFPYCSAFKTLFPWKMRYNNNENTCFVMECVTEYYKKTIFLSGQDNYSICGMILDCFIHMWCLNCTCVLIVTVLCWIINVEPWILSDIEHFYPISTRPYFKYGFSNKNFWYFLNHNTTISYQIFEI